MSICLSPGQNSSYALHEISAFQKEWFQCDDVLTRRIKVLPGALLGSLANGADQSKEKWFDGYFCCFIFNDYETLVFIKIRKMINNESPQITKFPYFLRNWHCVCQ